MNVATQQIIQWHLKAAGEVQDRIDVLIAAIKAGMEKKQGDAQLLCAQILYSAQVAASTSSDAAHIARLFELHFELDALDIAEEKVDSIT
jgi:hypothetical protein